MTFEQLQEAEAYFRARHREILDGAGGIPNVPVDSAEELRYLPLEQDYAVMADAVPFHAKVDRMRDEADTRIFVPWDPFSETDGLSDMWKYVYGYPICRGELKTARQFDVQPKSVLNKAWLDSREHMVFGKLGDEFIRPSSPTIVDLMSLNVGWDVLEAAHALTHLQSEYLAANTKWTLGLGSRSFDLFENIARLVLAMKFDLVLNVSPGSSGDDIGREDAFRKYGILVVPTTQFGKPSVVVPMREDGMVSSKRCVVSAAIKIEPHPHSYNEGGEGWREINRWSCHPSMVDLVGWECCDFVSRQPVAARWDGQRRSEFVLAPGGLRPMDCFKHFLTLAEDRLGPVEEDPENGLLRPRSWLGSDLLKAMLEKTPPLPCPECMRLNLQADGSPMKPKCRKPEERAKKGEQPSPEQIEWDRWSAEVGKICKTVEKAVSYQEGRIYGASAAARRRRRRKANHNKRVRLLKQANGMLRKYKSLMNAGQVTGAMELEEHRNEVLRELNEVVPKEESK